MKTTDYNSFSFFSTNRQVSELQVNKIINSIKKIGYVTANPILVNKNKEIIDGQHRFEACKRLFLPIYYEVINIDENVAMVELNTSQKLWKVFDYVNSYAKQGVYCYQQLSKFYEKHNLGESNSIDILYGAGKASMVRKGFVFEPNKNAENIATFLFSAKQFLHFYKHSYFVRAVVYLFQKTNEEQRLRIAKEFSIMKEQSTVAAYLQQFENLHNLRIRLQSKRISLTVKN